MASGFVNDSGHPLLVDGEIVVFDESGRSSFQALQNAVNGADAAATFVAFDILYGEGRDLRELPLDARKEQLAAHIVEGSKQVLLSKHVVGAGSEMFALAEKNHLEGIIAKRRDSLYRETRTKDWLKIKVKNEQEVIIVGYTSPRGSRSDLGSLILGVYAEVDGKKQLVPAGHVGTGFDRKMLATLRAKLDPLQVDRSPLTRTVARRNAGGEVHWVEPVLVCQVRFAEWTDEGVLRQASFLGMRDDKPAREVVRELPKVHPAEEAPPARGAKTAAKTTKAVTTTGATGLDALESDARSASVTVGGRTLAVSNLGKVLYPADGVTKGQILAFYRDISPYLLPHLARRPLTLERHPDGIEASSFFEKNVPRGAPPWLTTQRVAHGMYSSRDKRSETRRPHIDFVVCDDLASLLWLVNLGSFVMHIWTSRVETLDQPDWVLFDLDPGDGCTVKTMALVALAVRDALEAIGLPSLVKTTGGHGLHVIVPLVPGYEYDEAKAFAELVARRVESQVPELVTLERTIAKRPAGRIYFDYVQVGRGKTMVPPYVLRAEPGAPVSMPLEWSEVEAMKRSKSRDTTTEMRKFTLKNALARLEKKGDLWADVTQAGGGKRGAKLEPALQKAAKAWT
jgi:bifunctional non-homologous end joining protein LigD